MSRPFLWFAVAVVAAPAFAFVAYHLAKELGYLDPPVDRQHELRRSISIAVYAIVLFLPVLVYGFGKRWPTAWILFGLLDGAAILFFAGSGLWAARELWSIRHPEPPVPTDAGIPHGPEAEPDPGLAAAPIGPPPSDDAPPPAEPGTGNG